MHVFEDVVKRNKMMYDDKFNEIKINDLKEEINTLKDSLRKKEENLKKLEEECKTNQIKN